MRVDSEEFEHDCQELERDGKYQHDPGGIVRGFE
jgi:hypothetical protein